MAKRRRHHFAPVRDAAGARANCPVVLKPGNDAPRFCGSGWHYITRAGEYIRRPSAYSKTGFSNMIYRASDERVEVGAGWLKTNAPGIIAKLITERIEGTS